jgi:hypothetical protein
LDDPELVKVREAFAVAVPAVTLALGAANCVVASVPAETAVAAKT